MNLNEFDKMLNNKLAKNREIAERKKDNEQIAKEIAMNEFNSLVNEMVDSFIMAQKLEMNGFSLDTKLISKYTTGCYINNKFGIICHQHLRPQNKGIRKLKGMGIFIPNKILYLDVVDFKLLKISYNRVDSNNLTSVEINDFIKAYKTWKLVFDEFVKNILD